MRAEPSFFPKNVSHEGQETPPWAKVTHSGWVLFSMPLSGPCKPTCLGYMLEPFLPGGGLRETPPFEVARAGFRLASRLNCIQLSFRSARADFMRAINPYRSGRITMLRLIAHLRRGLSGT
jgi:hypothetical protein